MESLTLIVPCFNEEQAIPIFMREYNLLKTSLWDVSVSAVFFNDGSTDRTLQVLREAREKDHSIGYISFSRNFGKEAAIYAGIQHVDSDYVCILDVDLQDPPSLIPEMLEILKTSEYESVATRRVNRSGEPAIRSACARLFYKIMNRISDVEIVDGARDFRLMSRKYLESLKSLHEVNRFSKGLYGWVGYKTKWIEFENVERSAGETKWSFWKLFKYSIDGIVNFSTAPLTISSAIGIISCVFALIFMIVIIIKKLLFGDPVTGWASLATMILFIGGIQLLTIGILGQYIARIFTEVKQRPVCIIEEQVLPEHVKNNNIR